MFYDYQFASDNTLIFSTAVLATSLLAARYITSKRKETNKDTTMKKRVSFTTQNIAMGALPDYMEMFEPVIQVLISFPSIKEMPTEEEITNTLVPRFLKLDRMKGIPRNVGKECAFVPKENLNPEQFVRFVDVTCNSIKELGNQAQKLNDDELRSKERDLPWWEFVLLRNHSKKFPESMLVLRIDHAIGDGLSIGRICSLIMTNMDGSQVHSLIPTNLVLNKKKSSIIKEKMKLSEILSLPLRTIKACLSILFLPCTRVDHQTAFSKGVVGRHAKNSGVRNLIVFDEIPLDFVKKIKNKAKISLNDVLIVTLSQAIHDFCHYKECAVIKKGRRVICKTTMTFGIPKDHPDLNEVLHNGWYPLSLSLGVGHEDIFQRIKHVTKGTKELKTTPIVVFQALLQDKVMAFLPRKLSQHIAGAVYKAHSLTCTNVPGPQKQVMVLGKPVSNCRFSIGHLHSVLSMLSYNGKINVTLVADDDAITDVHLFPIFFHRALVKLGEAFEVEIPQEIKNASNLGHSSI